MKYALLATLAAVFIPAAATAQTTLPLNTGFNHSKFSVYPAPGSSPVSDNYWIKVAASNPPATAPAFVINPHPAWKPPLSAAGFGSQWIGFTPTGASPPGPMGYAIFRKCFCLMRGYQNPQLSLEMRGDDAVQVWLNTLANNIVPGQGGSFSGPPVTGKAQASQFRTGQNCLYVLVEDVGGVVTGFNLAGTVSALGLMPMAAAGAGTSYAPCQCEGGARDTVNDRAMIQSIVMIAEQHRRTGWKPSP